MTRPGAPSAAAVGWRFTLFTAGDSDSMHRAEVNLRRMCEGYVPGDYAIDVIDVLDPNQTIPWDVLAVPVVVRTLPTPQRRVIGDLSQTRKAAEFLGLTEVESDR